jgi:hypothetical protein
MEARVLAMTRKPQADGSMHWSSRKMARELGISHVTVAKIWARAGLKPHRLRRPWKVPATSGRLNGNRTEEGARTAVGGWLRLKSGKDQRPAIIVAHNDWMAKEALSAFGEVARAATSSRRSGATGSPTTARPW